MELKDMGKKMKSGEVSSVPTDPGAKKERIIYPSLHLSNDMVLDELKGKKLGDTCRLELLVKLSDLSDHDGGMSVGFDILKMGYISDGKKSKKEYLDMPDDKREEYDRENIEEGKED